MYMHMLKIIISRHQFKSEVFVLQTGKLFTFPDTVPPQITNIQQFQSPSPKSIFQTLKIPHLSSYRELLFGVDSGGLFGQKVKRIKQSQLCFPAVPPDYKATSFLNLPSALHHVKLF